MISVIEFDFAAKKEANIDPESVTVDCQETTYYWINSDNEGINQLIPILERMCPDTHIGPEYFQEERQELVDIQPNFVGFSLFETRFYEGRFAAKPVKVMLGEHFMATICDKESHVIRQVMEAYHGDFVKFSRSPGFLLFEIVDFLTGTYQLTFQQFEYEIEGLQAKLLTEVDDEIFFRVADSAKQLLAFRFVLVSAREIVNAIAIRKSQFISETTQPFLERKVGLLTRLSDDLATQRAVISDTLNLYMGFVSYQTNKVINRLTIISVIFLPLTFLVGIYGMNFTYMPELGWRLGYLFFWALAVSIVVGLLLFFRNKKWLQT